MEESTMREKTFYTSVGRLTQEKNLQGIGCPTVLLRNREYQLDMQELIVWTCLSWRIVRKPEIAAHYADLIARAPFESRRTLDACIDRLLVRGLLVRGSGETEYDALYDLLSAMYIMPVGTNKLFQLFTALKLVWKAHIPLSSVRHILRSDRRTQNEKQVMALANQDLLSTAEIIRCVEMGVDKLPNKESIIESIYSDRDTTSDNIAALVKTSPCTKDVTVAVANLYLRKQILFDRV
jgi:hypothetical protein